jgi:hypothetical protein
VDSGLDDVGYRAIAALGERGAKQLLGALERSNEERAALIGRLHAREDARWLAGLLMDLEDEAGEIARIVLIAGLRTAPGGDAR